MMRILFSLSAAFLLIIGSAFTIIYNQNWQIANNHQIKFSTHKAEGNFKTFSGELVFNESNLAASSFNVQIEVASINTGNALKNNHAKSAKWFDAKKYPYIKFVSTAISKSATGFEAKGDLEMHGVKKQISIPFNFSNNSFKGKFEVNRKDYGIVGVGDVGNTVALDITVPVTKK
jgi:polyisoprenoid-binding protein YceI